MIRTEQLPLYLKPDDDRAGNRKMWPENPKPPTALSSIPDVMNIPQDCSKAKGKKVGAPIGAVIIEKGKLIAVANDRRWTDKKSAEANGQEGGGNPTAHAVMRAIGLVASKRRLSAPLESIFEKNETIQSTLDNQLTKEDHHLEKPLTNFEEENGEAPIPTGGYLCLDMDIYITHEPCVMCSMAILHSRFGRVVFGQRMRRTGGMCAEIDVNDIAYSQEGKNDGLNEGLGYGLFWRQELNWRLMAWQWEDDDADAYGELNGDTHV
ncbi:MAG: hypothetical protein Q9219_007597 [cf. Caloplaca sp. 3 TL-2023]